MIFLLRPVSRLSPIPATWRLACFQYTSWNFHPIKIKILPAPPIKPETYISKNENLKRALSPHLTIYKPQITSMMSITLRLTGFTLGIMTWAVGLIALISDENNNYLINELKKLELDDCWWTAAKTVVVFPFAFHIVAGVRHLLFDTCKLLEKPQYHATGYAAIVLAFILAACLGTMEDLHEKWEEMKLEKELEKGN